MFYQQIRTVFLAVVATLGSLTPLTGAAQDFKAGSQAGRIRTNSLLSDWYLQMGLDMSLQNPYGYNFSHVFPNGKSFGLDMAIGKWVTPQVGVRGKFNWENALPLLKNGHANWLAPFDQPGVNRDKGGYIAFYGDLMLNAHNLLGDYHADRKWNLSVYPRIGINYNFGVKKGALLLGGGILNTYRLSEKWSVYADAAYMLTGSGFVGQTESGGTGTGSNSNGYFSVGIGAQYHVGTSHTGKHSVQTNGFWHNWFVQAGLDMSLMNPYGCDFSEVFPKGKTFGLNGALGKWFTPEFGIRGRLFWENGIVKNSHLEWVPPTDAPEKNHEGGGFGTATVDVLFNVTNMTQGYRQEKKWHTSAFARAGLISQFEMGSGSPLMGAGIEQTYRVSDALSIYGDLGYQVTTSESSGGIGTGMEVAAGSNGFFNIDLGIKIDLGKSGWKK